MCGRFTRASTKKTIVEGFQIREFWENPKDMVWKPRYNVCPDSDIMVILMGNSRRAVRMMGWGYHLPGKSKPLFNCRDDKMGGSSLWRSSFKSDNVCYV